MVTFTVEDAAGIFHVASCDDTFCGVPTIGMCVHAASERKIITCQDCFTAAMTGKGIEWGRRTDKMIGERP